ncbi:MAG: cysteine--tRNA ligase [Clostridiales bacterium]|jgi:cysteinyl-tRNA synthetase|nr:cysteine--tRNA ligase [Clostridiales bacterium]
MKFYNTLTQQKEEFVPLSPGQVRMYACGETVYNYIHIGHARSMVIFDALRRYLEYRGYSVTYARNFTDIDDKIIARANAEGVPFEEVTRRYIAAELEDMEKLGVRPPTVAPRATEEIEGIIGIINTLLNKGFAYENNGAVFFETRKFSGYGKLSKKNIDDLEAGARVEVDADKKNPMDFVLWKPGRPGEPSWASPWGHGRPGWHIECSAMAKRYLGDTIDIHAGGTDLIFPHHENEIAQSECANEAPLARFWLHNGLIYVDGRKMSKSFGNFFTIRDLAKKFPHEVIRFFMINSHYRSAINFSEELMTASASALERIRVCVNRLRFIAEKASPPDGPAPRTVSDAARLDVFKQAFESALDNDFNTADAVAVIFDFVKFANVNVADNASPVFAKAILGKILDLCDVLGILTPSGSPASEESLTPAEDPQRAWVEEQIEKRQAARAARDFKLADAIRAELAERGILLEDTVGGARWKRSGL